MHPASRLISWRRLRTIEAEKGTQHPPELILTEIGELKPVGRATDICPSLQRRPTASASGIPPSRRSRRGPGAELTDDVVGDGRPHWRRDPVPR